MRCTRCDGLAVPQAVGLAPDGQVVARFRPPVAPEDPAVVEAIEAQLPA